MIRSLTFIVVVCTLAYGCTSQKTEVNERTNATAVDSAHIASSFFGVLSSGDTVKQFTLVNNSGVTVKVINYGGIITALTMPDKNGKVEDIVLGYDSLQSYLDGSPYFGAIVGRYGNRIAKGKFALDGKTYKLAVNNGENHLHGGLKGFDKVFWDIQPIEVDNGVAIRLTYTSADMEEGFPGALSTEVTYHLDDANALKITYKATTDKKTVVNLTQHTYFNLSGAGHDILDHTLVINADSFLPVDKTLIPTGELKKVEGTPFDFRKPTVIGSRINEKDQQLIFGNGYDHCWVLNKGADDLSHAATLYDSASGRQVMVYTTEPGIQFYTGNFLDGTLTGKGNVKYDFRTGLCLETQHFPDSPNQDKFPSVVLSPGETYSSETIYKFSVNP